MARLPAAAGWTISARQRAHLGRLVRGLSALLDGAAEEPLHGGGPTDGEALPVAPSRLAGGPADPSALAFRIGPWLVEPSTGRLRHRAGAERHLRPQEMDLLCCLAAQAGRVVSKEEILATVWNNAEVEEVAIPRCVSAIRKALGDDPRGPRFIETIPKRGYRLISASQEWRLEVRPASPRRLPLAAALLGFVAVLAGAQHGPQPVAPASDEGESRAHAAHPTLPPVTARRPAVAVVGFANLSGEARVDWLATALSTMLASELARSDGLRVVAGETVALMKHQLSLPVAESLAPETLRRVHASLGADLVVVGSYLVQADGGEPTVRLDLRLQDTASGETVSAVAESGALDRLADLAIAAGSQLRQSLGVAPPTRDWTAPATYLPADAEALRLYAEGLGRLRRFEAAAARDLLLRAVARQPKQPLAHLALAEAWAALGHDRLAGAAARRAHGMRGDLPRDLQLWIEARYLASLGRWGEAVELYEALWVFASGNLEYGLRLAEAQNTASRPEDALRTVTRIRERAGPGHRDPRLDLVAAESARLLGRHEEALAAAGEAERLGEALQARLVVARGRHLQALALHALGRLPEAAEALERARVAFALAGDRRSGATVRSTHADWLTARGAFAEAREQAEESLRVFREIGDRKGEAEMLRSLAGLYQETGQFGDAEPLLRQAITISRESNDRSGEARALRSLGILKGIARRNREARDHFAAALAIFREVGNQEQTAWVLANLGKLALFEIEAAQAETHLREAEALARGLGVRGLLATVRFNQGYASWLTGDPGRSAAAFGEAIELYRSLENAVMVAASLQGLGEVHLARGELQAARACVEEALAMRTGIAQRSGGDPTREVESRVVLASLLLEEGQPEAGERMARQAVESRRIPLSLIALARTLVALRRVEEAESLAQEAAALLSRQDHVSDVQLRHGIVKGLIQAAAGDAAAARATLSQVLIEARGKGAWILVAEAELALGETEVRSGAEQSGRARLGRLETEAAARGLHLLARKAQLGGAVAAPRSAGGSGRPAIAAVERPLTVVRTGRGHARPGAA